MHARQDDGRPGFLISNQGNPATTRPDLQTSTSPTLTATSSTQGPTIAATTENGLATTISYSFTPITSHDSSATPAGNLIESSGSAEATSASASSSASASFASDISATAVANDAANLQSEQTYSSSRMNNGAIAAAVVVPLLVLALLAAVLFLLRKRRRQKEKQADVFVKNMTQPTHPLREHYNMAPMAAGVPITAYFTGLDTGSDRASSHNATRFSDEPPPPYKAKGTSVSQPPPVINEPVSDRSETRSSMSWRTAPPDAALLDSSSAAHAGRDADGHSITSTAYSDNASLHSARAARMSVGGAHVISTLGHADPFNDPASPVSSVDGDESRALNGNDNSRAVSPISFASRRNNL